MFIFQIIVDFVAFNWNKLKQTNTFLLEIMVHKCVLPKEIFVLVGALVKKFFVFNLRASISPWEKVVSFVIMKILLILKKKLWKISDIKSFPRHKTWKKKNNNFE